jgi:steroid 5-alpha reductase family enzyme
VLLDPRLAAEAALSLAVALGLLWLLSLRLRDASIVDIFWGLGFAGIATLAGAQGGGLPERRALVTALTVAWGLRLALYIAGRNWGRGEDPRYRAMRESWGARWWWVSLGQVFALQGTLLWVISLPVQVAEATPAGPLGPLDLAGAALTVLGVSFETIGDAQLARFKAQPENRGQVMTQGLWGYTRHPNYFGDFCVWWGLFLIATAAGGAWTVISPLVMSFLLMRVSGVPMLERQMKERPGYAEYVRRTSSFFPRPPRS